MFGYFLTKFIGSKNDREIKRISPFVDRTNGLEQKMKALSDARLRSLTPEFRQRLEKDEPMDDLLPEAFAAVREASCRTLGQRHFDAQIIGGIALHEGKVTEMKTGEGKTLAATLPVYLNAVTGRGVHVVTVNDYLARRDAEWMGVIYKFLGLTVGNIVHDLSDAERKTAYGADITYGTNNEFGFDYLRDNMKFRIEDYVQRELHYAIVDEVDSILIDEARTPLIISGPTEESTDKYYKINRVIPRLKKEEDYTIEEKSRTVVLTDDGIAKAEKLLGVENLFDPQMIETLHHVNQAMRAHTLFKRDVDYVVQEGQVVIVDEFTGRLMPGRRWSDGLHQAVEAKENVTIANENQTLASITFQNFFRMYDKLAGMTGTADTEAAEFNKTYELDVLVIPTNEPMVRADNPDVVYKSEREKFKAVVEEIEDCNERGQPALVGTISIENSEKLSRMLKKRGIPHHVLNAKHHDKEAEIVAQAGRKGAVTISTNMAGRGTDIMLGGNPVFLARKVTGTDDESVSTYIEAYRRLKEQCETEHREVIEAGGLHIMGTERHESRRIDNQLRGRSGRQGDPGSSRFFLSLEDDLMRIFGSERIQSIMDRLGMEEDIPIEHNMVSRAIENAQRKVEGHHFDIRKNLLEYDDVMNKQREVIYEQRKHVLSEPSLEEDTFEMIEDLAGEIVAAHVDERALADEWDITGLNESLFKQFAFRISISDEQRSALTADRLRQIIVDQAREIYKNREEQFTPPMLRHMERMILLQTIDHLWKDHLLSMDYLREGIGLRGYGQRNPLQEYKKEGFDLFQQMIDQIKVDTVEKLFRVQLASDEDLERMRARRQQRIVMGRGGGQKRRKPQTVKREGKKVGRNEPCPCGSGKKYKKCCGA